MVSRFGVVSVAIFICSVFFGTAVHAADIHFTLSNGKKVILKDDGTWHYQKAVSKEAKEEFEISDFGVTVLPEDMENGRYQRSIKLIIFFKNNSNKTLSAWRAQVLISNVYGDELWKGQLTDGSANLGAGQSSDASFVFEDNPFLDNEPYDRLSTFTKKNMTLKVLSSSPIFR